MNSPQPNIGDVIGTIATVTGMLTSALIIPSPHQPATVLSILCVGGLLTGFLHGMFIPNNIDRFATDEEALAAGEKVIKKRRSLIEHLGKSKFAHSKEREE